MRRRNVGGEDTASTTAERTIGDGDVEPIQQDGESAPTKYTPEQQEAIADPRFGRFSKAFIDNGDLSPDEIREASIAAGLPERLIRDYVDSKRAATTAAAMTYSPES